MSERALQAEAEGREEKTKGGQREGDWKEVSSKGGLVQMSQSLSRVDWEDLLGSQGRSLTPEHPVTEP